ncbi:MAG: aminotransferase class V-fold PLP-dependent enzyme [Spirochaetes bacterium]|uniref:Aminotransferase class V-fold PLP-dependent enzyme n=1 Tax=Candidatus Ornithospirochaeta stercoripullorum TaxID=2840899 RepID=A0A9D9H5C8_9SPIO|nr:aminotransferase class V-fold PLP-dependent enzyme [Candidatus Ornithospirochaeta stercoripullorum]
MKRIYLDNAATSFPKAPGVAEAVSEYLLHGCINLYRTESRLIEENFDILYSLRSMLARLYNYPHPECIAFTKNITEAMNWIIKGLFSKSDHLIVSSNEHNAVMRPIVECGIAFSRIPSDATGYNDYSNLESLIRKETKGIIINAAGNVSGAVQDLTIPAGIARKHHLHFIVDTAQASPFIDINMEELGIAALGFTGHKGFLGPDGTGGMLIKKSIAETIPPLIAGGTGTESDSEDVPHTLPERLSAGTENLSGLTGLECAMRYTLERKDELKERALYLTERLMEGIRRIDGVTIKGADGTRPRTSVVSITSPCLDIAEIASLLLKHGNIETRVGLHCAPSAHKSLGTFPTGTLRFSPGPFTTEDEIDTTIEILSDILNQIKG